MADEGEGRDPGLEPRDRRRRPAPALTPLARIERRRRALPENVRALGWISFANDAASELAYPLVPLFLTVTLGAPVALVGLIEGLAEGVAVGLRWVAGWLSDRAGGRRRVWIAWGYGISTAARPVLAAAPAWGWVLGARLVDRLGKALRTAPRDALIRDSTPRALMGEAFGYHRALDTAGAVVGPLLAVAILGAGLGLRTGLWIAVAPAVVAVLLVARVREAPPRAAAVPPPDQAPVRTLGRPFWLATGTWVLFCLGNSSDVFLLLRAHRLGLSTTLTVLAYALYNVVYSSLAWPLGALSDRLPRRYVLAGGLVVFALVYLGFAGAPGAWAVWPLFAVYGGYVAATEGVARAWVADHVAGPKAGTAFGVFNSLTGGALLVASVAAGQLWDHVSPASVFVMGAAGAAAAVVLLVGTELYSTSPR